MGTDKKKSKKKCCQAYLKKGKMCSNCPLREKSEKKEKKKKKKGKKK